MVGGFNSMLHTGKLNFVFLLSHFEVNISTTNIDKVVLVLFLNVETTPISIR